MPVQLGAPPQHGFDEPLGLLSDCHRRIEQFLAVLHRIAEADDGRRLPDEHRAAAETALTYFRTAAPRHNQDEEQSLFPLLRSSARPAALAAMEAIQSLEDDHAAAATAHQEVDGLYRRWMDAGHLDHADRLRLICLLKELTQMYQQHIQLEDTRLFPLAAEVLSPDQLDRLGTEMAARRGLPAGNRIQPPAEASKLDTAKMPGHWLLARLGKRVLRPGGLGLTRKMLSSLKLTSSDHVVEFAPGLGVTAQMALASCPASYTAVERDAAAANQVRGWLGRSRAKYPRNVITGLAQQTGLPDTSATVVYGEAMLSMQTETRKRQIIHEAMRLLRPGGRYGIHELCLAPDDLPPNEAEEIRRSVTAAIHHQASPLTVAEWESLLRSEGFEIAYRDTVPMALLEPMRLVKDEGVVGAVRFLWRVMRDRAARARVLAMRRAFRQHRHHLSAICIVAGKPPVPSAHERRDSHE